MEVEVWGDRGVLGDPGGTSGWIILRTGRLGRLLARLGVWRFGRRSRAATTAAVEMPEFTLRVAGDPTRAIWAYRRVMEGLCSGSATRPDGEGRFSVSLEASTREAARAILMRAIDQANAREEIQLLD